MYTTYPGDVMPSWTGWAIDPDGTKYCEGYVAENGPYPAYAGNPINKVMLGNII